MILNKNSLYKDISPGFLGVFQILSSLLILFVTAFICWAMAIGYALNDAGIPSGAALNFFAVLIVGLGIAVYLLIRGIKNIRKSKKNA